MKYATFNEAGEITGRYDSNVHGAVPEEAIVLPDALWFATFKERDGIWRLVDGAVVKQPLPVVLPDYPAMIASERYKREGVGITVEGSVIDTTRDGQALIAGAAVSAILDPNYRCNWKTSAGFVELNASQLVTIATAVREHVQACFDRELALLRAIEAGEYSDDMLTQGWPDSLPPPEPEPAPAEPQ
jgi:hypothetical protein